MSFREVAAIELVGPAGSALDRAVVVAIRIGIAVESIEAKRRYRVNGSVDQLNTLIDNIGESMPDAGVSVRHEAMPERMALTFTKIDARPARFAILQGGQGTNVAALARAVDCGLTVRHLGAERFRVEGKTRRLAQWMSTAWPDDYPLDRAYKAIGVTAAQATKEDSRTPDTVHVDLPTRETTSVIERRDGDIAKVTQTERSV